MLKSEEEDVSNEDKFEDAWISVDALLLLGVLKCSGLDSEKATVFHRVVAPEYDTIITITDKDLSTGIRFLVSTATILEEMTRDFVSNPAAEVDYAHY